jgi:hypothetical protein
MHIIFRLKNLTERDHLENRGMDGILCASKDPCLCAKLSTTPRRRMERRRWEDNIGMKIG